MSGADNENVDYNAVQKSENTERVSLKLVEVLCYKGTNISTFAGMILKPWLF